MTGGMLFFTVEAVADVSYNGLQAYYSQLPLAESMRAL
jgi:hypothetical protein